VNKGHDERQGKNEFQKRKAGLRKRAGRHFVPVAYRFIVGTVKTDW
jgi:hypothetical protein